MRNLRLDICYDGTRYRGWQRLPGVEGTIQGKLETALSRILQETVTLSGSGRTDAGVHAAHQIANFHCESPKSCEDILHELRRYLPEDIGIYSCQEASPRFHARLNATGKTYCYRIWNSEDPCVFERRYLWALPERLDVEAMDRAAQCLVGTHDFSCFCGNSKMKKSTVRRIDCISLTRQGQELLIAVTGNGFLQNMVRILVGTLVEVGTGQRGENLDSLFGQKREKAGFLAPPQGLCLMEVTY